MDIFSLIMAVNLTIITVVLFVVGIQAFMVLRKLRDTIERVDHVITRAEHSFHKLALPVANFTAMAGSLGAGLKIFESFVGWINRNNK
jgi:hypothetical protein